MTLWLLLRRLCLRPVGPPSDVSIATAKAARDAERLRLNVDDDGKLRRLHGLSEIHRGTADHLKHVADRPTGYAFTFKDKGK